MKSALEAALACVVGAVEVTREAGGTTFHRSPGTARAQLGDPGLDFMSATPSGVRIAALTDAARIEMDVALVKAVLPGGTSTGTAFDIVIDGDVQEPVRVTEETLIFVDPTTGGMDVRPAGPATVRCELGAATGERRVEIWFPAGASLSLLDLRIPDGATLRPAPASGPLWVHHGSSISQCSEVDRPTQTWPAIVARATGRSLLNLAIGGNCHLDQFMARTIRDVPATVISLELGINVVNADSMRERAFVSAFHGFLDTVREGHHDTPILIITPIICPAAEHRPGPTLFGSDLRAYTVPRPAEQAAGALSLSRIREILHEGVEQRRKAGDTHLRIIDGLRLFGPDDVDDLPDGLHPNPAGYRRIAERFRPLAFGEEGV
jgi:lysophospholipase L1-like esterase